MIRNITKLAIITIMLGFAVCEDCQGKAIANNKTPEKTAIIPKTLDMSKYRKISVEEYRDKLAGGWFGQMAGVTWGGPTETKSRLGKMLPIDPATNLPKYMKPWNPKIVNGAFGQDDIYVEMTFLATMEKYGYDCSIRQAGIDFANTRFTLACANYHGRCNLQSGIAPPDSSHPKFHPMPNALDYQIEADYSGLIAPGMPNVSVQMGEKFGRLMNYADGLYSGQYVGAMYAEAYFETDMRKVVKNALKAIPEDCYFAEMVHDMLKWSKEYPDWKDCFEVVSKKYWSKRPGLDQTQPPNNVSWVDVRGNMAYVLMGLLYGENDFYKTAIISTQCGMDSDCNPSTAAGVLLTSIGFKALPKELTGELNRKAYFVSTSYNFEKILEVCEDLTRQAVVREGGKIENGMFIIPIKTPTPSKLERGWEPGPLAGNTYFTDEENAQILMGIDNLPKAMKVWAPDWALSSCGTKYHGGNAVLDEYRGRGNVLKTHVYHDKKSPCILTRDIDIPAGKNYKLAFSVNNHPGSSWRLEVYVESRLLLQKVIDSELTKNGWYDVEIDLSKYAGKTILLELKERLEGTYQSGKEFGYWADLRVKDLTR